MNDVAISLIFYINCTMYKISIKEQNSYLDKQNVLPWHHAIALISHEEDGAS